MTKYMLVCQKWEESEAGWGTRPDGYSLHLSDEDRRAFIQAYWDRMPDTVQEEYSRPDGTAYWFEATAEQYQEVKASSKKFGVWKFDRTYPGNGGKDGWKKSKQLTTTCVSLSNTMASSYDGAIL